MFSAVGSFEFEWVASADQRSYGVDGAAVVF